MIYKVCLELIKRVGQNERNALGFYNILLSLLKLPVDDFDGLDRWLLLEHVRLPSFAARLLTPTSSCIT